MNKITIVGSGLSATIAKIKFNNLDPNIISCSNSFFLKEKYLRRKSIESNKLFSKKSLSYGNLRYKLNNIKLHDRLILGGSTGVWGGMVNTSTLPNYFLKILENNNIFFKKLDFYKTGYKSNKKDIKQMCDENGHIFNSSKFFSDQENNFLHSFSIEEKRIKLKIISEKNLNFEIQYTDKLILGISLPQLLDLLIRSEYIKDKVNITLEEFDYGLRHSFSKSVHKYDPNKVIVVKYSFFKIIDHFFSSKLFKIFKFIKIPFYVDQVFFYNKKKINLSINTKLQTLHNHAQKNILGNSIHYCNLSIDQININKYLKDISKNIFGISMPFVSQKIPGPIANDIINHTLNIDL